MGNSTLFNNPINDSQVQQKPSIKNYSSLRPIINNSNNPIPTSFIVGGNTSLQHHNSLDRTGLNADKNSLTITNSSSLNNNDDDVDVDVDDVGELEYLTAQGKSVVHYILNPHKLRQDHPMWHYCYLIILVFTAFFALFIGPVVFGMLAAFGGIGAPFVLSIIGAGIGIITGLLLGVVFSVILIVGLVKVVGLGAGWVLDALWLGGNDLIEVIKNLARMINIEPFCKNVIITGASWGLGAEMAYHSAKNGASNIILAARQTSLLEKVADKCRTISEPNYKIHQIQTGIKIITCDLANEQDCKMLITKSVQFFKDSLKDFNYQPHDKDDHSKPIIDILILNHTMGIFEHLPLLTDPKSIIQKMRQVVDVNVMGFTTLAHYAIPYMIPQDINSTLTPIYPSQLKFLIPTRILIVSSLLAEISLGMSCSYSATKSAMNSYFTSLRDELLFSHLPITITIFHLGAINTEEFRKKAAINVKPLWVNYLLKTASDPVRTTEMMLRSTMAGDNDVWYPFLYGYLVPILYALVPGITRRAARVIQRHLFV
ncbi:hypothetical protein G9A89_014965 [Geosiphon pyriformis]|nr:hypothetical protein G9A89_014965 [Geosiphon pyriformis]